MTIVVIGVAVEFELFINVVDVLLKELLILKVAHDLAEFVFMLYLQPLQTKSVISGVMDEGQVLDQLSHKHVGEFDELIACLLRPRRRHVQGLPHERVEVLDHLQLDPVHPSWHEVEDLLNEAFMGEARCELPHSVDIHRQLLLMRG